MLNPTKPPRVSRLLTTATATTVLLGINCASEER